MNNQIEVKALYRAISSLAKHEGVTKAVLGDLSRKILALHLGDSASRNDVKVVNRLLSILTPVNKRAAVAYFQFFLPFQFDEEACTFGVYLKKEAKRETKYLAMASFLHEEENNIWTWQLKHLDIEPKQVNYAGKVTTAINAALRPDKGGLSPAEVLQAVFAGGVSVNDVVAMLEAMANPKETLAKAA